MRTSISGLSARSRLLGLTGVLSLGLFAAVPLAASSATGVTASAQQSSHVLRTSAVRLDAFVRPDAACPTTPVYSDETSVTVGNGYNSLAIRTGACIEANSVGNHNAPNYWAIKDATHAQMVCNTFVGEETDVWYQEANSPYDWSWAGGTNKPDWSGSC